CPLGPGPLPRRQELEGLEGHRSTQFRQGTGHALSTVIPAQNPGRSTAGRNLKARKQQSGHGTAHFTNRPRNSRAGRAWH
ncbi:MAG: hypothetical protein AVDCRST_MAG83-1855, partial [uncultured Arthrobacter sp.]